MNEGKKTGIFWIVAAVTVAMAGLVSIPNSQEPSTDELAGTFLFQQFKDPISATSMRIVTFDDEQGQLESFEVRKDASTGLWAIPSREGYPADAIEQMRDAANSLVGLKILNVLTTKAEEHDDLGVLEPKIEKLEVGDEGVGRLVTFKDENQQTLASLIIGKTVEDDESKRYVRIPNQDPVYEVKLDISPLTTKFTDWIEEDLLQLSSIDIEQVELKEYSATLGQQGIALERNFTAMLAIDGPQWELSKLLEFDSKDPRAEPKQIVAKEGEKLDTANLDAMKNALDDLKIVGVFRKPEGVSATLKASEGLMKDQDAVTSLARRGFYPVQVGLDGEAEILSANGEMLVSLQDGVRYILRFGNIAGLTTEQEKERKAEDSEDGVNRFLFVTTQVDESMFPAPDLQSIPQTLEELEALLNPKPKKEEPETNESEEKGKGNDESVKQSDETEAMKSEEKEKASEADGDAQQGDQKMDDTQGDKPESTESEKTESEEGEPAESVEPADGDSSEDGSVDAKEAESGENEASGQGEATGTGQAAGEADENEEAPNEEAPSESEDAASDTTEAPSTEDEELSEDEKIERLEAEQEKITKANQRKLDARNDKLKAAQEQVDELNERFADWYYVISESTYGQLKITRDELFTSEKDSADDAKAPGFSMPGGPQLNIPGLQPNGN